MTGTVIAFPGVDLDQIGPVKDPLRQTIRICKHQDAFILAVQPSGGMIHWRFKSAIQARSYAGDLCHRFPRLYRRVIDDTRSTRPSVGEMMAGAPFEGDAA